jgi:hypothetical protein
MQTEHEGDRPSEQKRSVDKAGFSRSQTSFAARLLDLYPVETRSVEKSEKDQDECADAERRERFEFIRNLIEKCRNSSPAVFSAVSHGFPAMGAVT